MKAPSLRLTLRRLEAMQEALIFRMAGEIEEGEDMPDQFDYDYALYWVNQQIAKRKRPATEEKG